MMKRLRSAVARVTGGKPKKEESGVVPAMTMMKEMSKKKTVKHEPKKFPEFKKKSFKRMKF
jgi:hypothetical protein